MARSEKETTFQGQLYMNKDRDGEREKVASVESGAAEIEVAAHVAGEMDAGTLQEVLNALAERIKALEDAE